MSLPGNYRPDPHEWAQDFYLFNSHPGHDKFYCYRVIACTHPAQDGTTARLLAFWGRRTSAGVGITPFSNGKIIGTYPSLTRAVARMRSEIDRRVGDGGYTTHRSGTIPCSAQGIDRLIDEAFGSRLAEHREVSIGGGGRRLNFQGTVSGRTQSAEPNITNVPRTVGGPEARGVSIYRKRMDGQGVKKRTFNLMKIYGATSSHFEVTHVFELIDPHGRASEPAPSRRTRFPTLDAALAHITERLNTKVRRSDYTLYPDGETRHSRFQMIEAVGAFAARFRVGKDADPDVPLGSLPTPAPAPKRLKRRLHF